MLNFLYWLQGEDRRTVSQHQQEEIVSPVAKEKMETNDDIDILTEKYGTLVSGLTIKLELQEACTLLGRKRKRVDAFKSLQKLLKDDYGVELIITSRKTHEQECRENPGRKI